MALTNNGVDVTVNALFIPDGYTLPTVTTFPTAGIATWTLVLAVDRATVQNATEATTFGNIVDDATVGISAQAQAIVEEWNDGSADTVDMFVDFYDININVTRSATPFYTDADDVYLCSVRIYAKIS